MATLASNVSTTITLNPGDTLTTVGAGVAVYGPGPLSSQQIGLNGTVTLGPFPDRTQTVYLTAGGLGLTYTQNVDGLPSFMPSTIQGLMIGDSSAFAKQVNAANLAAALSSNGLFILPAGAIYHDPFVVTGKVTLEGQGASDAYGPVNNAANNTASNGSIAVTSLVSSNATGWAITFDNVASSVKGIHFENTAAQTAGHGIVRFGKDSSTRSDGAKALYCSFKGGYTQLLMGNTVGDVVHGNVFFDPIGYCLWMENYANVDEKDPIISGNSFNSCTYPALAAIYFKAGGGLKIVGNKINREPGAVSDIDGRFFRRGIHIDNPNGATSVLTVTGNSLENIAGPAIDIDSSTAGQYNNVNITGNEFYNCNVGTGFGGTKCVQISGRSAQLALAVNVSENVFHGCGGILMQNVNGWHVGVNVHRGPRSVTGNSAVVHLSGITTNGFADPQITSEMQTATATNLLYDTSIDATDLTYRSRAKYSFGRECKLSKAAYVNLYTIELQQYQTIEATINLVLNGTGIGPVQFKATRTLSRFGSTASVLKPGAADYGIDTSAGTSSAATVAGTVTNPTTANIDLLFDTATANQVTIKAKIPAGSTATATVGTIALDIEGCPRLVVHAV